MPDYPVLDGTGEVIIAAAEGPDTVYPVLDKAGNVIIAAAQGPADTYPIRDGAGNPILYEYNGPGGGGPTLEEQVATIIGTTKGWLLRKSDMATQFQDDTGLTPVTALAQPVGRIVSKYGSGTVMFTGAGSTRPVYNGGSELYDNSDDILASPAPLDTLQDVASGYMCMAFKPTGTLGSDQVYFFSTGSGGTIHRHAGIVGATGTFQFSAKRLDADALTNITCAAGVIVSDQTHVLEQINNYATGAIEGWVNGVLVASGTMAGTPGNSENTAGLAGQFGRYSTSRFSGYIGDVCMLPFVPTTEQRATIRALMAEVPL